MQLALMNAFPVGDGKSPGTTCLGKSTVFLQGGVQGQSSFGGAMAKIIVTLDFQVGAPAVNRRRPTSWPSVV